MTDPAPHLSLDELLSHRQWVRALALRLSASDSDADDLAQDAWMIAIRSPPRGGAPRAWLGTVLRNLARTRFRRTGRRERREFVSGTASATHAATPTPADLAAAAEVQTRLAQAVLALDEPYRATILYRWFEGWETSEIALRTGVPLETVRTRLRRAVATLRERLRTDIEDERGAWGALLLGATTAGSGAPAPTQVSASGAAPALEGTRSAAVSARAATGGAIMGTAKRCAIAAAVLVVALGTWVAVGPSAQAPVDLADHRAAAAHPGGAPVPSTRTTTPRARAAAPTALQAVPEDAVGGASDAADAGTHVTVCVVAEATRTPIQGAFVSCPSALNHDTWLQTGADGRVRVPTDAIEGLVLLEVRRPTGATELAELTRAVARSPGEALIRVAWPTFLRGRVEANGGAPAEVRVICRRTAGRFGGENKLFSALVGADGSFELELEPGRYLVWTEPMGPRGTYWTHERRADVDPSGEPIVFHLRRADGFECVLTSDGVQGEGLFAAAYASPQDGEISFQDTTDTPAFAEPVFTLRVAPDVLHDVWAKVATKGDFTPALGWGVARGARPGGRIEIAVRPAWNLRLTLVDASGDPVREKLPCMARPERAAWDSRSTFGASATAAGGEALLLGLPPLPATVFVGGPGHRWCSAAPLRVEPGTSTAVVTVVPTRRLRGRLEDKRGRPVVGSVTTDQPWFGSATRVTAAVLRHGWFDFESLVPGKTKVRWAVRDVDVADLGEIDVPARGEVVLVVPEP